MNRASRGPRRGPRPGGAPYEWACLPLVRCSKARLRREPRASGGSRADTPAKAARAGAPTRRLSGRAGRPGVYNISSLAGQRVGLAPGQRAVAKIGTKPVLMRPKLGRLLWGETASRSEHDDTWRPRWRSGRSLAPFRRHWSPLERASSRPELERRPNVAAPLG